MQKGDLPKVSPLHAGQEKPQAILGCPFATFLGRKSASANAVAPRLPSICWVLPFSSAVYNLCACDRAESLGRLRSPVSRFEKEPPEGPRPIGKKRPPLAPRYGTKGKGHEVGKGKQHFNVRTLGGKRAPRCGRRTSPSTSETSYTSYSFVAANAVLAGLPGRFLPKSVATRCLS